MKVFLRKLDDNYYVWKDATYSKGYYFVDGARVYQSSIVDVKNDFRDNHVVCDYCGEIIKNDPESIEAHFAEREAARDCIKCPHKKDSIEKMIDIKYEPNDDGTFNTTEISQRVLRCGTVYYNRPNVLSEDAKKYCVHYQCRHNGVRELTDVFVKYPHLFDTHITVDVLRSKKFEYEDYSYGYFEYDLKCKNAVKACVNELGYIDHFRVYHRNKEWNCYYSAKYDKLFFSENGEYTDVIPRYMSEQKYNMAKDKISKLYKEAIK